jgi:hypothetical protein
VNGERGDRCVLSAQAGGRVGLSYGRVWPPRNTHIRLAIELSTKLVL